MTYESSGRAIEKAMFSVRNGANILLAVLAFFVVSSITYKIVQVVIVVLGNILYALLAGHDISQRLGLDIEGAANIIGVISGFLLGYKISKKISGSKKEKKSQAVDPPKA